MSRKKITIYLIYTIIIALTVAPAFVLGDGNRNLLLIGVMGASPLMLLAYKGFFKLDVWLILLMASLALAPLLNHPESMRWSTVLYSWMFCLAFMAYNRLLHKNVFTASQFLNLMKYLLLAYFITLVIQQVCVLVGLPVFNASNYSPEEPWKLNSLSPEPSHSARIVALLFYCFLSAKEIVLNRSYNLKLDAKKDQWVWIAFLWTMLTMGSATAFLFVLIVTLKFVQRKNIIPLLFTISIAVLIIVNIEITAVERMIKTTTAVFTLDPNAVIAADHSASFRIVPMMVLVTMLDIFSLDGLLGHGIDSISSFLYLYMPGAGNDVTGGGSLHIWYEYGFIAFLSLMIFTFKATITKKRLTNLMFWVFLVFMYSINSQLIWICIILLFTINYYTKINDKSPNT